MSHQILSRGRTLLLVGLATSGAGALAVTSSDARPATAHDSAALTIVFKVKGPTDARRNVRFCHKHKRIRIIKRGALTTYKGVVTPPFVKHFDVTVKLERCSHGRFVRVTKFKFQGKRLTGKFESQRRAPRLIGRITFYSAVAVVNGVKSNKRYFAVVR